MLLLSPPQCHLVVRARANKQPTLTSHYSPLPLWTAPPAAFSVALRSLQDAIFQQSTTPPIAANKSRPPYQSHSMSAPRDIHIGSPRSSFSPTLGSIQEVFEYEEECDPLDITSQPPSPLSLQDASSCVLPEPATTVIPTLSLNAKPKGIILNPRKHRAAPASFRVTKVLRRVLEADKLRRRRILRIYLKAIVFLKLLVKSHERYGALMATSGVYVQCRF